MPRMDEFIWNLPMILPHDLGRTGTGSSCRRWHKRFGHQQDGRTATNQILDAFARRRGHGRVGAQALHRTRTRDVPGAKVAGESLLPHRPYDPAWPQGCLDETSKQLIEHTRAEGTLPISMMNRPPGKEIRGANEAQGRSFW